MYITILFYISLFFLLDFRKNTEGNKILYAIFKWNFFYYSTFCLFLHVLFSISNGIKKSYNNSNNNSTRMNYLYVHTKFNRLDACLFCYALFFFAISISPPSSIYGKLAGPLGRAVKRFIIFMLIPNVFNVYEMYTRVRTRFPFFVLLLNWCCCCCCCRCVEYNLSGWKTSIYQSKNVACKIPFGKISCHFQINDAQIYSSLSLPLLLSQSHPKSAVKFFRCEMPPLRG